MIRSMTLAIAGLGFAAAAPAAVREVAPGHFECRSPAGRYERADGPTLTPGRAIHARFRFRGGIANSRFAATAGLVLRGEPAPTELQITSFQRRLSVEVRPPGATRSRFIGHADLDDEIEVTAAMDSDGALTISHGRRSVSIPARAPSALAIEVTCQSGSFEIEVETASPSIANAQVAAAR